MRGLIAALAVSLLASAVTADERDVSRLRPGALLFASPEMVGSIFEGSVILLTHHDTTGSAGLIINRPTDVPISDVVELEGAEESGLSLYIGGPVTPGVITALAKLPSWNEDTTPITADLYLVREAETLTRLLASPGAERTVRVYAGYAGWTAQQLAGEVRRDTWLVARADPDKAFLEDPSRLWLEIHRLRERLEARVVGSGAPTAAPR